MSAGQPPTKRFIAGAVCPGCGEEDKLRAWREGEIQHRECVRCGFTDRASASREQIPKTRIQEPQSPSGQAMRFYPSPGSKADK